MQSPTKQKTFLTRAKDTLIGCVLLSVLLPFLFFVAGFIYLAAITAFKFGSSLW